jgi:hypothetical protein
MLGVLGAIVVCTANSYGASEEFRAAVEADWLLQEELRVPTPPAVTPEDDAVGAVDGIINGEWGFHTEREAQPWWQVDLGDALAIDRVVIWNRCEGSAERTAQITVLLSGDANTWVTAYVHDGTPFQGFADQQPLVVPIGGMHARYVKLSLPGEDYLHLDEVEVFAPGEGAVNLALNKPATQSSISQWSNVQREVAATDWRAETDAVLAEIERLGAELAAHDQRIVEPLAKAQALRDELAALSDDVGEAHYLRARWIRRELALSHPLLNFDQLFFTKRVPAQFNHMSDQYYGWWSRPGGGMFLLEGFREDAPTARSFTEALPAEGSFLRPMIDYAAKRVLFAWCKYYPELAAEPDKLNKANVPEDAFNHLFEMNLDGTGLRQLTFGKYDDFDGRYLPDGRIVFLSTRRGHALNRSVAQASISAVGESLPDCYVRCGGGPERPVAVYTLHTMNGDGSDVRPISPFEMFEWTPTVGRDGTILYSRWDYIDRDNMPYMSLWSIHPNGTNARIVYGNFTHSPHCTFEPMSIPGSDKIVFLASAHHAQTMGSLVLLDPAVDSEGVSPITRLTPEVCFPEIEGWPLSFFAHPWPLSEEWYLVSWGPENSPAQGQLRATNAMGLYLFHTSGYMELLYRDPEISSVYPMPVAPREKPPIVADPRPATEAEEGRFILTDVYQGLKVEPGSIHALRLVAVPPKTHPTMNFPSLGLTSDDPGKCVLGTVPVEKDGSAFFRIPAGVIVFFQALDKDGMALQTMRSSTHVQPGQTLSCIGCHESRHLAPPSRMPLAVLREPSKISRPPEGAWPLRFDTLVQPVLDRHCIKCHHPDAELEGARRMDFTAAHAYETLTKYGKPSPEEHVRRQYRDGFSLAGDGIARKNDVIKLLRSEEGHNDVKLAPEEMDALITWLDTYAQRLGSYDGEQEAALEALMQQHEDLLTDYLSPAFHGKQLAAEAAALE